MDVQEALRVLREVQRRARSGAYSPQAPTKKQREFLSLDCLEALYGGAAGGGKSSALLLGYFGDADDPSRYVRNSGYAGLILRRSYTDLALPGAIMDRSHEWLAGSDAHWDGDTKTWVFPSGATLTFGYLDTATDHYRYQSAEFQYIAFDELTQFREHQYRYMMSRLRKPAIGKLSAVPLRARAATNPGGAGHDWVQKRFIDSPEDRAFVPAVLDDNPHLDRDAYEDALAQLDSITHAQLRHGSWARDTSQLVYKLHDNSVIDERPAAKAEWHHVLGVDYGNVDATALAVIAYNKHDLCSYVVEANKWDNLTPSDAAEVVDKWQKRYGGFDKIVADTGGLGKGYAEEARKRFKLAIDPATKTDKLGAIKLFNGDLEHGKIKFIRGLADPAIAEMRALSWKDQWRDEENPAQPNHCSDAVLYAWRQARAFRSKEYVETPQSPVDEYKKRVQKRMRDAKNRPWWSR